MDRALAGAAALAMGLTLSNAAADNAAEDIAKYRHAVMESSAGHMSALALIAKGKVDRGDFAQSHAEAIASATTEFGSIFPEGSGGEGTHALPAIWENPDDFQTAVDKAREAGAALSEAAAGGERKAIMSAFAAMGKACKGCHENYREEHDH